MTKDRFVAIQTRRGYTVEVLGNMVRLTRGDYWAIHFFNKDGSPSADAPMWGFHKKAIAD